jgi:hypothetical protein
MKAPIPTNAIRKALVASCSFIRRDELRHVPKMPLF